MRFHLEAKAEELEAKGPELIQKLIERLGPFCPDLEERVDKAFLPKKEPELKFSVLRGIEKEASKVYRALVEEMIGEIRDVIDGGEHKDHTEAIATKDGRAYGRVIAKLTTEYGYTIDDFTAGGRLYGKSTNELIELARSLGKAE